MTAATDRIQQLRDAYTSGTLDAVLGLPPAEDAGHDRHRGGLGGWDRPVTGSEPPVVDRPDRLEEIAATRGTEPDVRWLIDEVVRLRGLVDAEHAIALELARRINQIDP